MRVNPENIIIEGVDGFARIRKQYGMDKSLIHIGLPGSMAQIETSRKHAEQERPNGHLKDKGGLNRETIEGSSCKRQLGVGSAHSSDEALEGLNGRRCGAKGLTEQGTRRTER